MFRLGKPLSVFLLLALTAAIYWKGLSGGFFFDDNPNIVENPALHLFNGSFSSLLDASTNGIASPLGRPLSMATFAISDYYSGGNPFDFKLFNLVIHLLNGVLVFFLTAQLLPRLTANEQAKDTTWTALWVMAVWLVHPINLVPTLFVVQRMTSLAAFFTLAALCLYLFGRQKTGYKSVLCIVACFLLCWPAAILSKETGVLLPFFVILLEWFVLGGFRSIRTRVAVLVIGAAALLVAGLLFVNWDIVTAGYRYRNFTMSERLLTESRVLWFYLIEFAFPWPDFFSLYHDDFAISRGWLSPPSTAIAVVGWLLLVVGALRYRKKSPALAFCLGWFLVAHALESTILPLELVYEHRNYVASLGPSILLCLLLFHGGNRLVGRIPKLTLAAGFILFCGLVTTMRASQWSDNYLRTQFEANIHPNSARANYDAALAIFERTFYVGNGGSMAYQMVKFHFERAAELDSDSKLPLVGLLYLNCLVHAPKDDKPFQTLQTRFAESRFLPIDRSVIHSLSRFLAEDRLCLDDREVLTLIDAGLKNERGDGEIQGMLNAVAMDYAVTRIRSLPLALRYANAAIESNPGSGALRINLVNVLVAIGQFDEAKRQYAILRSRPIYPKDRTDMLKLEEKLARITQHDSH